MLVQLSEFHTDKYGFAQLPCKHSHVLRDATLTFISLRQAGILA